MEISNLLDAKVKTLVIRILNEINQNCNNIKKDQSETKDILTEMKNNLQGINSRVDQVKNQISDVEYKEAKISNQNNNKKNNFKE